jgi:6-phosphogluconate dehydrogenase
MREAQKEYNWTLNFGEIAKIWRGGCIIRAAFLQKITEAYGKDPNLANLLLDDYFKECLDIYQSSWRKVISLAIESGIPVPTFSSAIAYYDGYRSERLPQNLLQAQRDYFGAHTYERTDEARGKFFHLDWLHPNRPENLI